MNNAKHFVRGAALVLTALLLACASQMKPAQEAINSIEAAVTAVSGDAARYVPQELTAVQGKLAALKAAFDRRDYANVVTSAPAVLASAQALAASAAAKKDEIMKVHAAEWASLTAVVPALIATVQSRVTVLGKSKSPPKGVDLASAKSSLAEATERWEQAQGASAGGMVEESLSMARSAKAKIVAAATALKLPISGS